MIAYIKLYQTPANLYVLFYKFPAPLPEAINKKPRKPAPLASWYLSLYLHPASTILSHSAAQTFSLNSIKRYKPTGDVADQPRAHLPPPDPYPPSPTGA
ncbi:hypothetical protein GWI33_003481 [Rhynchophorus ferrugineus]|uniref:Uncharacterized protein n=1 Tax=Rhynchophorus ferrugineus TaxID=354439 RepID=A0A834HJ86_RHYFE|nr:hypothetical protein GWI33_003481 [Rhynchophorus ferrugineus]